ncbi:NERD domain-containing protein [Candidatus Gracilibacteria bacterium]|nr:NERD domain-containing protein [Candidatus Gracilibacteria bacterium]
MSYLIFITIIFLGIAIFIKWKWPVWIGRSGEKFVSRKLHHLDPTHYRILNDLMLPSDGNSSATQIDHVVVSNFGIFCIETKAYKGWIFGNANQEHWTQVIFRFKDRFYNPLRQNFAHVKAVENLLGSKRLKSPIISLVAFPDADKLKISGTDSVGYTYDVVRKIANYTVSLYTDSERDEIFNLLASSNIVDKSLRKLHNAEVRGLKKSYE